MRKLYRPHFRGPGDGLVFHFLFGFRGVDAGDRLLVAEELPLVMDDIAALIRQGYTVVLDTEGTLGKLRQALYSDVQDIDGLRTAGVFWSSPGREDGTLEAWDGGRVTPEDLHPSRVDRLLRIVILACSWASARAALWQQACGAGCHVFAWDGQLDRGTRLRFLDVQHGSGWGLGELVQRHMLTQAMPPAPPEEEVMTSVAPTWAPPEQPAAVPPRDDARTQLFQAIPGRPPAAQAPPQDDLLDDARTRILPAVAGPLNPGGAPPQAYQAPPSQAYQAPPPQAYQAPPVQQAPPHEPAAPPRPSGAHATLQRSGLQLKPVGVPRAGFSESFDGKGKEAAPAASAPAATSPPAEGAEGAEATGEALAVVSEAKKPADPLGNIANSVFQAFSGGRSLDQVVGEQLKKHKVLGGVASTVLPGLVSFAGSQAAQRVNNTGAQRVIASATEAAQKILTPEEQRAKAMVEAMQAPATPEGAADPDEAPPQTPKDVEQRLRRVAADCGGECSWQGPVLQITVPLQDGRHHTVHARLIPDGEAAVLSMYCHVGQVGAEVNLNDGLRLTAQTYFARISLLAGDHGDALVCQSTLPRLALTRSVLRIAVEELASVADGLEAWLFGHDVY